MTAEKALRAILARISGEWDNPDLIEMGALHTDPLDDIALFAHNALEAIAEAKVRRLDTTTARFSDGGCRPRNA